MHTLVCVCVCMCVNFCIVYGSSLTWGRSQVQKEVPVVWFLIIGLEMQHIVYAGHSVIHYLGTTILNFLSGVTSDSLMEFIAIT